MTYYYYEGKSEELVEVIRWCRTTFGPRGDGWDFATIKSGRKLQLDIWNPRLEVMWILWKS